MKPHCDPEGSGRPGDPAQAGDWVPAVGAGRRVRALVRSGWSIPEQARRSGLSESLVRELADGFRKWIHRRVADAVADLFTELRDVAGGSTLARNRGLRNRWPPPAAWGQEIDDPASTAGGDPHRQCPYCGSSLATTLAQDQP